MGFKAPSVRGESDAHLWGFSESATGVYRILLLGTSVMAQFYSPLRVVSEHLKTVFGNARETNILANQYGGAVNATYQGWVSESYGGIGFYRRRGSSASSADQTGIAGYGDEITVQYSTETDGAVGNVLVDGALVGTIDCTGSQSYGNKVTFGRTELAAAGVSPVLGYHTVTIQRPVGVGYVRWEAVRIGVTGRTGIAVVDGTLGGSSLSQASVLGNPGSPVAVGAAVVGTNGIDALSNDSTIDAIWMGHVVNDAGINPGTHFTNVYKPLIDRMVANTRTRNIPLVLNVEPAGHWALSGANQAPDPSYYSNAHDAFETIRSYQLALNDTETHVKTVDQHGATIIDDLEEYARLYYPTATGVDQDAGTFTLGTDFIHPVSAGHQPGVGLLCDALSVPTPPGVSTTEIIQLRQRTPIPLEGTAVSATLGVPSGTVTKRYTRAAGFAIDPFTSDRKIAYYADEDIGSPALGMFVSGGSPIATVIGAAGTSDATYGAYVAKNQASFTLGNEGLDFTAGDRLTFLIRIRNLSGGSTPIAIRGESTERFYQEGNPTPLDGSGRPTFQVDQPIPVWVCFQMGSSLASPSLIVTGDVFEGYAVRNGSVPVMTSRKWSTTLHSFGPPQRTSGDPDPSTLVCGQTYFEQLPDATVQYGQLISSGEKLTLGSPQTKARAGVYRAIDPAGNVSTSHGLQIIRPGTSPTTQNSVSTAGVLGTGGESAPSNPPDHLFGTQTLAASYTNNSNRRTLLYKPGSTVVNALRLKLINGGTTYYLQTDGTWSSSAADFWTPLVDRQGENLIVTFDLPITDGSIGASPNLRLEPRLSGGAPSAIVQGTVTLCKGQRAMTI